MGKAKLQTRPWSLSWIELWPLKYNPKQFLLPKCTEISIINQTADHSSKEALIFEEGSLVAQEWCSTPQAAAHITLF